MSVFKSLKNNIMIQSRTMKEDHFYLRCKEGMTVLDVGVHSEPVMKNQENSINNHFLKNFRYPLQNYTGLGVQDLTNMEDIYPGACFIQYPGVTFPFDNNEFDWVYSNAVIEHVGNEEAQLNYLNEMLRVGKNIFFTTPNKFFPVEAHTNLLFIHWSDNLFYKWCEKNRPQTKRKNLYLFSHRRLNKLLKRSNATKYHIYKNRTLGMTMTFTIVC